MNWDELYELQNKLDQEILQGISKEKHGILEDKILALLVELGELANETRCFKYWSQKPPSARDQILEEFVDGLHFILSLGLDYGYRFKGYLLQSEHSTTTAFLKLFDQVHKFKDDPNENNYNQMMLLFLQLGNQLNFTESDIFKAYLDKNKVNHYRQQTGY